MRVRALPCDRAAPAADQPLRVRLAGSSPVEVTFAELLIGHFALQHVVGGHQDRVSDRHGGFFGTTSAFEAAYCDAR